MPVGNRRKCGIIKEMKKVVLTLLILLSGCVSHRFDIERYRKAILNIHFTTKDMYFTGDNFKVGNFTVAILKIYPPGSGIYGRVEIGIRGRSDYRKVNLDLYDYYILDSRNALVVLDVDSSDPLNSNVTLGICSPSQLPLKLSKVALMAASLSPEQFILKVNGKLITLSMNREIGDKFFKLKLTAVSSTSGSVERKGNISIRFIATKNLEISVDGTSLLIEDIIWDMAPSMRKISVKKGIEIALLKKGERMKLENGECDVLKIEKERGLMRCDFYDLPLGDRVLIQKVEK